MKKALVIGGRGKVGNYLVPLLVRQGYHVITVSRGRTAPCAADPAWEEVEQMCLDRSQPGFEAAVAGAGAEVVADMICFESADMLRLADALEGNTAHYLVTGSCWIHGHIGAVPVRENECCEPLDHYGEQKKRMTELLAERFRKTGFPGTVIHPGHIVCPGTKPISPLGFADISAFEILRRGEKLCLPNFGMETLHHVHAADVAGVYLAAIQAGQRAFGEDFHAVSPRAVTLRGFAEEAARWYGKEADLCFEPFDVWKNRYPEGNVRQCFDHLQHSLSASPDKTRDILGYQPRYTTYEAIRECLASFDL